jgi:hypothetical protein
MRDVMAALQRQSATLAEHPLYAFMRDSSVEPRRRLGFAPGLAHFVMTFADLYAFVLREEPARDRYQELVNAHTYEDGGHWRWFLADLGKLELDPYLSFSDALRFVWSDATVRIRKISYEVCRLGLGASSLHKLVLVHCIEATGALTLRYAAPLGEAIDRRLVYFGPHHFETEADHTLEDDGVRAELGRLELSPDLSRDLLTLVDRCFAVFTDGADELLALARRELKKTSDKEP